MAGGDTRRLLEVLADMLLVPETKAEMVDKVGCCLRLLVGEYNYLVVDLCDTAGTCDGVREGNQNEKVVDAIVHLSDADFALVCAGKLTPQLAFMTGRLAVRGNLLRAMKCGPIFDLLRPPLPAQLVAPPSTSNLRPPPRTAASGSVVPSARL